MVYWVGAACLLVVGAVAAWRYDAVASDPELWPDNLSFERQVALVRRYLRRQGWRMEEPLTWLNVFVRCSRGNAWLNLVIHDKAVLRVGTVAQDFIQAVSENPIACGLLTREFVAADVKHEMARYGLFVVRPSDLANVEEHIAAANIKLAEWAERRRAGREAACAREAAESAFESSTAA